MVINWGQGKNWGFEEKHDLICLAFRAWQGLHRRKRRGKFAFVLKIRSKTFYGLTFSTIRLLVSLLLKVSTLILGNF